MKSVPIRRESMRMDRLRIIVVAVWAALLVSPVYPMQSRTRQPSLIIDTDEAEGKDVSQEKKPKDLDPIQSAKSLKIGDYYLKRKNYKAAIQRYLEAIEYQPDRFEAYESLAHAYERNDQRDKTLDVYREFLRKYPESPKVAELRKKIATLEGK